MSSAGSSLPDPNKLKVGVVLLVGASGGLVTAALGASLTAIAVATLVALVLGVATVVYLSAIVPTREPPQRRR